MKSKREDIIRVGLLIQTDLSEALGMPCGLYMESGMCRVYQIEGSDCLVKPLTSVYNAETLYKVVLDIISNIQMLKLKELT